MKSPYTTFEEWSQDLVFRPARGPDGKTRIIAYERRHYVTNSECWTLSELTSDRIMGFRDLPGDGSEPLVSPLNVSRPGMIALLTEPGWILVDRGEAWFATPELKAEFDTLTFLCQAG